MKSHQKRNIELIPDLVKSVFDQPRTCSLHFSCDNTPRGVLWGHVWQLAVILCEATFFISSCANLYKALVGNIRAKHIMSPFSYDAICILRQCLICSIDAICMPHKAELLVGEIVWCIFQKLYALYYCCWGWILIIISLISMKY